MALGAGWALPLDLRPNAPEHTAASRSAYAQPAATGTENVAPHPHAALSGTPAPEQIRDDPSAAPVPHAYDLRATLDPETHQLEGEVTIRWTNTAHVSTSVLYLHLYLNAFESEGTVFMRESGGRLRGESAEGDGSIDLHTFDLQTEEGPVPLLENSDDELIEDDHTQLRVPLPAPVSPGTSLTLHATFTSRLPPVFARSGYAGDYHMVAQWFPKVARLESDGSWATFPYHGHGEFYADFADYRAEIQVPEGWPVGGSGSYHHDGTTHTLHARRVHDLAFVTSSDLVETTHSLHTFGGAPVALRVLAPSGYEAGAARVAEVTAAALLHFTEHYGEYPYPTLTVVLPPLEAPGAAGMEYPSFFASAGPFFSDAALPFSAPMLLQEHVTAHELGHQWFQGLVASNEVAHPMLDEGLTEWITCDFLRHAYGTRSAWNGLGVHLSAAEIERVMAFHEEPAPPPGLRADQFDGSSYGQSVYMKSASILETVARTWGRDRFRRALGTYARRWRFRHPTPEDFFQVMDEAYGPWMSERILRPALLYGGRALFRLEVISDDDGATIEAQRFGGLPIPTQVAVYRDGERTLHSWPGTQQRLTISLDATPDRVVIDPFHHNLTDHLRSANRWQRHQDHQYFPRTLWVLQQLMGLVGP